MGRNSWEMVCDLTLTHPKRSTKAQTRVLSPHVRLMPLLVKHQLRIYTRQELLLFPGECYGLKNCHIQLGQMSVDVKCNI